MSAICGIVHLDGAPVDPGALAALMRPLPGADPGRLEIEVRGSAGFCRLAPSRSAALGVPPPRPELLLAADARLDDRRELAAALGLAGPDEAGEGERALLLAAYERWGAEWHRHLRGAFALALWDEARRTLLLLRDPAGARSLYWSRGRRSVLFATEPVQLAAAGRFGTDRRRLLAYLLGALPEPAASYFEGVQRIPEGHQLRLTERGAELRAWWDWRSIAVPAQDGASAPRELARRLRSAVERRLPAVGEAGVLLSGGLDSTSVAVQAADLLGASGRQLHAFTWTSSTGDGIDETAASRTLIASQAEMVEHPIEADGLWPLRRYPEAYADPNGPDTNAFPDLLLETLEEARRCGVTVLLNGIGGDPVIGWLAPELALLSESRLGALRRRWQGTGPLRCGLVREVRAATHRPALPDWLTPEARRLAADAGLDRPAISLRALSSRDRFRRAALASPENAINLERFDRLSRRHGVRIEAPWHDPELAALVLGLPGRALDPLPPGKELVREAMAGSLPPEILRPGAAREPTRLAARGLLAGGRPVVEELLAASRLEEIGLVSGPRALAAYGEAVARRSIPSGLWETVAAESWLRRT